MFHRLPQGENSLVQEDSPEDMEKNQKILNQIQNEMALDPYMKSLLYQEFLGNLKHELLRLDIDFMQAPQCMANQLLWCLENKRLDMVLGVPVVTLLHQEVLSGQNQFKYAQVILDLDFERGVFHFMDMDYLAESFLLSVPQFSRKLFVIFFESIFFNLKFSSFLQNLISSELIMFPQHLNQKRIIEIQNLETLLLDSPKNVLKWKEILFNISKTHDMNLLTVQWVKDIVFNSPVMTPSINFPLFPSTNATETNPLQVDIKSKQKLFVLSCLGFLSPEFLQILSKSNNHQLRVSPFLSESFRYYKLLETMLKSSLEYALSRIFALSPNSQNPECFITTAYHSRPIRLDVPNYTTLEMPLVISKNYPALNLIKTVELFKELSQEDEQLETMDFDFPYTESEIIKTIMINLFHELGYLDKNQMGVGVLAQAMLEADTDQFHQEMILFFETLRLEFLDNVDFLPPIKLPSYVEFLSENNLSNNALQFGESSLGPDPLQSFDADPEIQRILDLKYQNSEMQHSEKEKIQEVSRIRLHKQENQNKAETRTFIIESVLYVNSGERERNFIMMQKNIFSNRRLSLINLVARVYILSSQDFVSFDNLDITCMQFVQCLRLVQKSLRLKLEADLVYVFFKSKTSRDLQIFQKIFSSLPFQNSFSISAGTLMKELLVQYCIYTQFKKSARSYSQNLRKRLECSYIEEKYQLGFCLKESLVRCKDLFEAIIQVHKKAKKIPGDKGSQIFLHSSMLRDAFKFFKDFFDFIFKKQHRVVDNARFNN
jgi:hypothetical protein